MDNGLPRGWELAGVQSRHEGELMRYPNVVGVATGTAARRGADTDEPCIVVYVSKKVPLSELAAPDVLPTSLEGVRVDVVQTGPIQAQGAE
ncbi:hypothetical protein [Specibacter sp. RAF43]|uniref:hypothetical protein n=1 Tax=Specibacter sp. RAF43 TaxID=3233057 RepID=UPI003F9BED9D